ncbi:biotin synthase [Corticibacter populi]|uniref:Biotin synthase n=1 Tax=Corticibacter populi TaxID=1550736 RepID=A0A3M6QRW2_9BURK|nr:biotin synthase [Corticibacter populi]RMX05776.1 biotin synthase [Corticibacter populi]RZS30917.1 malonyl-CoA O-methyltransferase [Corticibacter populi]
MPASASHTDVPPSLDPVALARWQARPLAASPWLHEEVGRRMQERLAWIVKQPASWCDWEPVRGGVQAHALVAAHYPKARQFIVHGQPANQRLAQSLWQPSVVSRWLRSVPAVSFATPAQQSVQMLWANMHLHQAISPPQTIQAWAGLLEPQGFLMFSCLGPDTAIELRQIYARRGWPPPAQEYTDMHDLGDMLVQQGFAEPVMDMEHIRLQFPDAVRLLAELRELGRNFHPGRFGGLRGRQWQRTLMEDIAGLADASGAITLTFEVIYGHAIKAPPRMAMAEQTRISLDDMRATLQKRP